MDIKYIFKKCIFNIFTSPDITFNQVKLPYGVD